MEAAMFGLGEDERQEAAFIEQVQWAEWTLIRKNGRDQFVWAGNVVKLGFPLGGLLAALNIISGGYPPTDLISPAMLAQTVYWLGGSVLLIHLASGWEWTRRERDYAAHYGARQTS
jgi:hypothetical protein